MCHTGGECAMVKRPDAGLALNTRLPLIDWCTNCGRERGRDCVAHERKPCGCWVNGYRKSCPICRPAN